MRIAIDGRPILRGYSGFATYTRGLLAGLAQLQMEDEFVVYLDAPIAGQPWQAQPNFTAVVLPAPLRSFFWKQITVPRDIQRRFGRVDAFHATFNSSPFTAPGHLVYTIHDLLYKRFPGTLPLTHYVSLSAQMWLGARRAALIVTDSEHSKRDICRLLKVASGKVMAIPIGVDHAFRPVRDAARLNRVRAHYRLPGQFILYVGSFLRHKNLPTLLQAFAQLPLPARARRQIVLAGPQSRNLAAVQQSVHQLGLQDSVVFPGPIASDDLPALYSMADLFVMPSLYEGFGLPLLEAMACGTPVVAASSSSLPEVVADAGLLVDGYDATAMGLAIEQALADHALRTRLIEAGLSRAARFTWAETARRTREAYQRACEGLGE